MSVSAPHVIAGNSVNCYLENMPLDPVSRKIYQQFSFRRPPHVDCAVVAHDIMVPVIACGTACEGWYITTAVLHTSVGKKKNHATPASVPFDELSTLCIF